MPTSGTSSVTERVTSSAEATEPRLRKSTSLAITATTRRSGTTATTWPPKPTAANASSPPAQTHSLDSVRDRRTAVRRMLDYYLHTAHAADQVLHPGRPPATLPAPGCDVAPEGLPGPDQARAWLGVERPVLSAAVDLASAAGFDRHAVAFAYALMPILNTDGHWHDLESTQRAALCAATRLADPAAQARAHHILGRAHARLVHYPQAAAHYRAAITLYRQVGDRNGEAHAHHNLAWVAVRTSPGPVALQHVWQALDLFAAPGPDDVPVDDRTDPLAYRNQALRRLPRIDDPEGRANVWESLGYLYDARADRAGAIDAYRRALELRAYCRDSYGDAHLLKHLGVSQREAGQPGAAREAWRNSLAIFDRLGHADADAVRTGLDTLPSDPSMPP